MSGQRIDLERPGRRRPSAISFPLRTAGAHGRDGSRRGRGGAFARHAAAVSARARVASRRGRRTASGWRARPLESEALRRSDALKTALLRAVATTSARR